MCGERGSVELLNMLSVSHLFSLCCLLFDFHSRLIATLKEFAFIATESTAASPRPIIAYSLYPRFLHSLSKTAPAWVKIGSVLVSDLPARSTAAVLSAFFEACVVVGSNDSVVKPCAVYVSHGRLAILSGVVFHKRESARRSRGLAKAHNNSFHIANPPE